MFSFGEYKLLTSRQSFVGIYPGNLNCRMAVHLQLYFYFDKTPLLEAQVMCIYKYLHTSIVWELALQDFLIEVQHALVS